MKQFNTLSKAIAQEFRHGDEVCFRGNYLATSLEADEILARQLEKWERKMDGTHLWFSQGWTMLSTFVADAFWLTGMVSRHRRRWMPPNGLGNQ